MIKFKLNYLFIISAISVSIAAMLFSACRYEEGPLVSFRPVKNRLNGEWKVTKFYINSIDSTDVYIEKCNCEWYFTFEKNTNVGYLFNCQPNDRGIYFHYTWAKNNNYLNIDFEFIINDSITNPTYEIYYFGPINSYSYTSWEIIKLMNKSLKLQTEFEGNRYEISLEKTREKA